MSSVNISSQYYPSQEIDSPLVIAHGLFGSKDNFHSIAAHLSQDRPVYTLDLRNHGESSHAHSMDFEDLAQDIGSWMQRNGLESVHLLGHSLGGKVVMRLACDWPTHIESLTVVDIAPVQYPRHHEEIMKGLSALYARGAVAKRSDARDLLKEYIDSDRVIAFLLKSLTPSPSGYSLTLNVPALANSQDEMASNPLGPNDRFEGPTLFIKGSKSEYILDDYIPIIRHHFPTLRIDTLDAGHWVHAEAASGFLDCVESFLAVS